MTGSTSPHRERGWLLAHQGRADLAEREYRLALVEDPHDAGAHALLALLLADQEARRDDALAEARAAIGLAPDDAFPHYAEAYVHLQADRWEESERAATTAIHIDPDDPANYAALSAALLGRRRWAEALAAADTGLELDPEYSTLVNLRAQALVQLGRRDEANATLHGALGRDPENSVTHANQGWALLHRGDREGALSHFRESLRLDPEGEWAREGLVEALKAKNPLYAAMLRYFLWTQRMDRRVQWMVIVGGIFGFNLVRRVARANPALAPWLTPLMVAYGAFVLLSWTAPQVFNAVLLASRDGRYALSDEQRRSGTFMAAGVGAALAFAAAALVSGVEGLADPAILFAGLLIPLAATFRGPRGRPTRRMAIATGVLYALAGVCAVAAVTGAAGVREPVFVVVLFSIVGITWIVNLRGG